MHRFAIASATLATLAVVVSGATPAVADSKVLRDPRGDAEARYDLTKIELSNSADDVSVDAELRDLRGAGTQIFGMNVRPVSGDTYYVLSTVRRANGGTSASIDGYDANGNVIDVSCRVSRKWRPAKDTILVSFARDCIPEQGPLRISLFIGAGDGSAGDPADWTKSVRVAQD